MGRMITSFTRNAAQSPILISGFQGNVVRWPGSGGIATVSSVGSASTPMVLYPANGLVYWFDQAGYATTVNALDPIGGGNTVVASFTCIPSPVTLGGTHPTPPFMASPQGGDGITYPGLPSLVTSAAVIGDQIYLGCHGAIGIGAIKTLVRFTPATGNTAIVHGPFQPTQYRTYLWPPTIGGIFYFYDLNGYWGDSASPGFVATVGGTLFWSAGALIFSSTSGDAGSWSLVYDGMGGDKYLTGAQTYGRHQPGEIDPVSGAYLFGATGQHVVSIESLDNPGVFQAQPYTVSDSTNPNPDGPRSRSIPVSPLGEDSVTPAIGTFQVDLGEFVAGGGTHQPVSRAVLALDAGGAVSVVYEDPREDVDIGRAEMGPVAVLWNGTTPHGVGAVTSGQTDWSPVTQVEPTFANPGSGWANDPIGSGIFAPFSGTILPSVPFGYGGKLYALHSAGPHVGTQLLVRDGAGAWSVAAVPFGVAYNDLTINEVNPPFAIVSTSSSVKV